ncbi:hypothetical protein BC830DRAFT_1174280 [Chytriomyces sp. MP71]|nr:hypothetical protein BC830DRAFT_1174280 [Chytriomyces sp. MP71]
MAPSIISFLSFASIATAPATETAGAAGAPSQIDLTLLNFALSLEHLKDTFASMTDSYWLLKPNFTFSLSIQHVCVPACTYNFDTALANVQNFFTNDVKTDAATIVTVEVHHSSFLNLRTNSGPAPSPFDFALGICPVITIAAGLIQQCSFTLPAIPIPSLTTVNGAGSTALQAVSAENVIPLMFEAGVGAEIDIGMMEAEVALRPTMLDTTLPTGDSNIAIAAAAVP